jgi:hypothetical protein
MNNPIFDLHLNIDIVEIFDFKNTEFGWSKGYLNWRDIKTTRKVILSAKYE